MLSAGHASMLLYALLHLTGYDLPWRNSSGFASGGSRTPGHPEHGLTPGVETTTGPLGQGFGNAVGMAMAERLLADGFNRPGHPVVDHHTYVLCSDGDLMEGAASEDASLAGHLRLGKLVCLYVDNDISIDGSTDLSFTEDAGRRFEVHGWHVESVDDGNDLDSLERAIGAARDEANRPSLVVVRTRLAFGALTQQDSSPAHGALLGADEVSGWRERFGWSDQEFFLPDAALARFRQVALLGEELEARWQVRFARWEMECPELAEEWTRSWVGTFPRGGRRPSPRASTDRWRPGRPSGKVLAALGPVLPELVGGSADLTESNDTALSGVASFARGKPGRYLHYGVRDHAMGAAMNGMALHGGVRPYGGTFLVFSDYMRPSIRLDALMEQPVIYVFTHDSIGLGEDGPTHQPVEHLAALRAIPGLVVIRPADAAETVEAWRVALRRTDGPTALVLSRQDVPALDRATLAPASGLALGAYVLGDVGPEGTDPAALDPLVVASGSEVHVALSAAERLAGEGYGVRVASMPSWELFEEQQSAYRDAVLPPGVGARLAVEAAARFGWSSWVGNDGAVIGLDRFGLGAGAEVLARLGFTPEHVAEAARSALARIRAPAAGLAR